MLNDDPIEQTEKSEPKRATIMLVHSIKSTMLFGIPFMAFLYSKLINYVSILDACELKRTRKKCAHVQTIKIEMAGSRCAYGQSLVSRFIAR